MKSHAIFFYLYFSYNKRVFTVLLKKIKIYFMVKHSQCFFEYPKRKMMFSRLSEDWWVEGSYGNNMDQCWRNFW